MMVFAGPVPVGNDWYSCTQFFAVRGDGPPVVLSQRLLHQRLSIFDPSGQASDFSVRSVAVTNGAFRVEFEHNAVTKTCDVTWSQVQQFLDEGDTSGKLVHHALGDYRLLPP
jgi:hypothetical protein